MENFAQIGKEKIQIKDGVSAETVRNMLDGLVEKEKPKLRHGDYGYSRRRELNIALLDEFGLKLCNENGILNTLSPQKEIKTVIGNIFDDLERMKEDLERFGLGYAGGSGNEALRVRIQSDGRIEMRLRDQYFTDVLSKFQEFHQKLGQLIATVQRWQQDC